KGVRLSGVWEYPTSSTPSPPPVGADTVLVPEPLSVEVLVSPVAPDVAPDPELVLPPQAVSSIAAHNPILASRAACLVSFFMFVPPKMSDCFSVLSASYNKQNARPAPPRKLQVRPPPERP